MCRPPKFKIGRRYAACIRKKSRRLKIREYHSEMHGDSGKVRGVRRKRRKTLLKILLSYGGQKAYRKKRFARGKNGRGKRALQGRNWK